MKNKMNLGELKVQSFVTDLQAQKSETAKGGQAGSLTIVVTYTLVTYFKDGCDIATVGHDDGPYCISTDPDAWCGGRP